MCVSAGRQWIVCVCIPGWGVGVRVVTGSEVREVWGWGSHTGRGQWHRQWDCAVTMSPCTNPPCMTTLGQQLMAPNYSFSVLQKAASVVWPSEMSLPHKWVVTTGIFSLRFHTPNREWKVLTHWYQLWLFLLSTWIISEIIQLFGPRACVEIHM